jgi:signal transduction histidine kinase
MLYTFLYATSEKDELAQFKAVMLELRKEQKKFSASINPIIEESSIEDLWSNDALLNNELAVNIYQADSLVFWNNNSVVVEPSQLAFTANDTILTCNLSNGFYLIEQQKIHDLTVIVSAKIKDDFYFKNRDLPRALSLRFQHNHEIFISTEQQEGYAPIAIDHKTLFYVSVSNQMTIPEWQQFIIYAFYLFGIAAILLSLAFLSKSFVAQYPVIAFIFPILLFFLRFVSIEFQWIKLFREFELFNPNLFATSKRFPNFGSLMLSVICVYLIIWWIASHLHLVRKGFWLIIFYLGLLPLSYFIGDLFESLVLNSSISLVIDEVFSLNLYSVLALLIIAGLFLFYFILTNKIIKQLVKSDIALTTTAVVWFVSSILYFFLELFVFQKNIYNALWPILLNALLFYIYSKGYSLKQLKYQVLTLAVISFYGAFILFESNQFNEHQKRDLYANQLITDQDPAMEIEYRTTLQQLLVNADFEDLLNESHTKSTQQLTRAIEQCCFDSYWERYEIESFIFNQSDTAYVDSISRQSKSALTLDKVISNHGQESSIVPNLFYIPDYHDRLSYLARETIQLNDSTTFLLFISFRSKKIPEQIGFPRLLMNEKYYALEDLEDYSIARYSGDQLIMNFGGFNYPTQLDPFAQKIGFSEGFSTFEGSSHYLYKQVDNQVVIISKPEKGWVEKLTTFSYLFLFFGIFTLVSFSLNHLSALASFRTMSLSTRIQVLLIGIVAVSFLIFAIVAGSNVERQYNTYTNDNLKEKVKSVGKEVFHKLEGVDSINPEVNGEYINQFLKKFSNVFVTDINLYAENGALIASSQPKLYETGISSKQMNPIAFRAVHKRQKSEFIHKESIGKLNYLSAYLPFNNSSGKLLGYLNLQHFAKQKEFENQLNDFIVAIINIAVLLLVITVVIAIFVAGWITAPLRLIQDSFRKVELGKANQPINYQGDDEIGALVKDYNSKLQDLELKAMQLARSERETAWREMAKQVAHEIKNPLTPMKLSLQHFQRAFSTDDPNAKEKIAKIADSLIEQINALTNIANEFSNFAKMPKANEEKMDLLPVLHNIIDLYSSKNVAIELICALNEVMVYADQDLLVRVFNNLVKNAIQAKKEGVNSRISINVEREKQSVLIALQDNGQGIPKALENKIFVPNFTTKSTGTGLGLAMVKQIIHNHNGDIWFESTEGVGTTFYIRLPLKV